MGLPWWVPLSFGHGHPNLLNFPEILEAESPGSCWPQFASGGVSAGSPAPLLVPRPLADDDRYAMSCPVTFLVATRGQPPKPYYFPTIIAVIIFLKPNLLTIEYALYKKPWDARHQYVH